MLVVKLFLKTRQPLNSRKDFIFNNSWHLASVTDGYVVLILLLQLQTHRGHAGHEKKLAWLTKSATDSKRRTLLFRLESSNVFVRGPHKLLHISSRAGHLTNAGPALSRLDLLLQIGPRAKGGPALRLLTYTNLHFLVKLLMPCRLGACMQYCSIFQTWDLLLTKTSVNCLTLFNTLFHQNSFCGIVNSGLCFLFQL